MPEATGEIVPTPGEDWPYTVVIRVGSKQMGEIGVSSLEHGEVLLSDILRSLRSFGVDIGNA